MQDLDVCGCGSTSSVGKEGNDDGRHAKDEAQISEHIVCLYLLTTTGCIRVDIAFLDTRSSVGAIKVFIATAVKKLV
jgi:hypothetical protein